MSAIVDDIEMAIDEILEKPGELNSIELRDKYGTNRYLILADIGFGNIDSYEKLRKIVGRKR